MSFQNILVPFDLSSPSNKAFKVALDLAQKYNSKITLITCVEGDAWHHKFYDARADTQLLKAQTKVAKKYMEKLEETANKVGVKIKLQIIKSTSVAKDIATFAKSRKMDIIVISSHGRTGFDKLVLGSVANGVIQRTSVPVLLIK
ncbi:MAG: universal stress protein [Nitrososphaeria archaeon]|nr:universal stress protein [Nitrosopumilaceae archaeon]NIP09185.1 universal stress protein [Nitrosopumilaceae archaeon]NIP91714.1 universal stress protein [Nitrososphaeria archaeon]NIS95553.1 universal stress protein [Nitrosopumilaceae archaeon]